MLYYIKQKKNFISKLLKNNSPKRKAKACEIYLFGNLICNRSGKTIWSGTGAARNALRLMLQENFSYQERSYINHIMKYWVGTDESYPFYLRVY